ncbi:MAG TPA: hypothetical protein VKG91_03640 [Roseiarcus sp.]|nr:hypothetical protein [Roseiarcus sp.]
MRHLFTSFLSTAAVAAVLAATPVAAQVAGNPGDQHTPTPYTNDYWAQTQGYAPGYGGPFAPVGAVLGGFGALGAGMVGGPAYATQAHAPCGVIHDFNGRYTSVCGP